MKVIFGFLRGLKLPVKLLKGLFRKRKKRTELERKCYRHVRLNSSSNISYQKSFGKDRKRTKKRKKGKFSKRVNNLDCKS